MRYPPEFLEEIKARLPASDVVGRRVRLKKAGREWRGLSPFNAEKTPSFFVNDAKAAWFDFSSGRNGNIFDFVMATDGLTFPEAVERLAGEAGLDLPRPSPDSMARDRKRASLADILELAAAFFERCLSDHRAGRARAYLEKRGVASAAQREFRLGYAPADRYALRDHLAGKGATAEAMAEAGLLVEGDGIAVPFDRFRDRIMFPIADRSGRVIAFGGRALDAEVPAKYLNCPETPLFHKGAVLFNHHRARRAASDRGTLIAVEGYLDVIALHSAGFPHVVAPLGTALTLDQCQMLWRMVPEPILCFDGDGAGRRAAFRAVDTVLPALAADRTLRFAFLPEGQDPDDLVRSGGKAAVEDVLGKARPLVDVLWARETERGALDTPERRAGLEHRLGECVRLIGDETVRRFYREEIRSRLNGLGRGNLPARRAQASPAGFRPGRGFPPPQPLRGYRNSPPLTLSDSLAHSPHLVPGAFSRRDVEILTLLINHPALLDIHAEEVAHLEMGHPELAKFRDLLIALGADRPTEGESVGEAIDALGHGELRRRIEHAANRVPHWCMKPDAALSDADQMLRQALALHRRARELHKLLRDAERDLGRDASESTFARMRDLQDGLLAIEGTEASVDGYGLLSGRHGGDV